MRSPIRCVSPEFVNAIAMNPGGRPKEVENKHCFIFFLCIVDFLSHPDLTYSREICTATRRPLKKWMEDLSVLHPQLVVRCFPKPLPFPCHRKPLTSTCVSPHPADRWYCGAWLHNEVIYAGGCIYLYIT